MRALIYVLFSLAVFSGIAFWGFRSAAPAIGAATDVVPIPPANSERQSIVLVHDDPELPPGHGRTVFITHCVVCHSPRYITMQPRFTRKVWTSEVHKMVASYKAPVSAADEATIVDYLMLINGREAAPE